MTAQQALQVLADATSTVQATRQQHQLIGQALNILGAMVNPPKESKVEELAKKPLKEVKKDERKQS